MKSVTFTSRGMVTRLIILWLNITRFIHVFGISSKLLACVCLCPSFLYYFSLSLNTFSFNTQCPSSKQFHSPNVQAFSQNEDPIHFYLPTIQWLTMALHQGSNTSSAHSLKARKPLDVLPFSTYAYYQLLVFFSVGKNFMFTF